MKRLQLFLMLLLALPIGMLAAGTEWNNATQLPLGENQSGSLSKDRTREWWKFTVTADGAAKITATPGSGLRIGDVRLYHYQQVDDFSNYWERTDNAYWMNPGWNAGSFTTTNLAPGTYLLRIDRGEGEGAYTLRCDFTANAYSQDKNPDDWNNTNTLPLDTPIQGHLGYGYKAGGEDSRDWWTFTVTKDGTANINIKHEGTIRISDLRLYHFQQVDDFSNYWERTNNNYWINPGWNEGNLSIPNLAPGKYLIRVERGEGQGGYQLTYTFTPNAYKNNKEPDGWDPRTESQEKPGALPLNNPVQGHLGYGYKGSGEDDKDWWTIEVTRDGTATIAISHDASLRISDVRIYHYQQVDDFSNYWERTDHTYWFCPGWNAGEMRIPNLAPGKYLIRVERGEGWGGYELSYTFEAQAFKNDPEPNNLWNEGRDNNYLARGQEKQGHLGYGYKASNEDNRDFYRIKVPCDGKVILTYTPTSVNSALRVSDVRLFFMATDNYWERTSNAYWINPGWNAGKLTIPDMAPGEYLVRVERGEGYGAYSLKYEFEQNELPNDAEPNNEWPHASKLVAGKTQSGHLGYGYQNGNEDDNDWYEVTMSSAGTLKINIQPGANLRIDDVRLYYYSGNKENCWERTKGNYWINPGWNAGSLVTENVEAGDYLIRVHRGEGYGNYRIAFNADLKDVTPLDPLPDENPDTSEEPKVVEKDGTTYEVDDKGNITITNVTPDDNGIIIICGYPGANWPVLIKPEVFISIPGQNVSIGYTTPPTPTGSIPEENVKDITLHVPPGTKEVYENHPEWNKFKEIKDDYIESQSSTVCLIVWMNDGEKHYYSLSEKPKITMAGGDFTLATTSTSITYEFDKVIKFTLDENSTTAIKQVGTLAAPSVDRQAGRVVFTGCSPKSAIRIYNMSGRLVNTQWTDESGRAEVSISGLKAGVYVVKSDNVTLKIAKR